MRTIILEPNMENKESVLTSLTYLLGGKNFLGKEMFIKELDGLMFLYGLLNEPSFSKVLKITCL